MHTVYAGVPTITFNGQILASLHFEHRSCVTLDCSCGQSCICIHIGHMREYETHHLCVCPKGEMRSIVTYSVMRLLLVCLYKYGDTLYETD